MKKFLEAGRIVGTHGLNGDVKVESWCNSPEDLCALKNLYFDGGAKPLIIEYAKPHKNIVLLKIAGIDNVDVAIPLRGRIICLDRDDLQLDDGEYFIQDLVGLKAIDADTGESYGEICDVSFTGANDVYHIKSGEKIYLIPAVDEIVIETDLEAGLIKIRPIGGMFDDEN